MERKYAIAKYRTDECTLNESLEVGGCSQDNGHTSLTISELKVQGTKQEQSG